jgi:hypothetical protein
MGTIVKHCAALLNGALAAIFLCVALGCTQEHFLVSGALRYEWAEEAEASISSLEKELDVLEAEDAVLARLGWRDDISKEPIEDWLLWKDQVALEVFLDAASRRFRFSMGLKDLWMSTGHCFFADVPEEEVAHRGRDILASYREFVRRHSGHTRQQVLREGLRLTVPVLPTEHCRDAVYVIRRIVSFARVTRGGIQGQRYVAYIDLCPESNERGSVDLRKRKELFEAMTCWLKENEGLLSWDPLFGHFDRKGEFFDPPDALLNF